MGCLRRMHSIMMATIVVVILTSTSVSEGQDHTGCAANLVPCVDFMNFTIRPPSTCCDPLSQAVAQQFSCLCNLFAFPSFFESLSINFTLDIRLPSLCGISTDLSTCRGGILPSSSSAPPKNNRDDDNYDSTENNDTDSSENNSKKNESTRLLSSLLLFFTYLIISA